MEETTLQEFTVMTSLITSHWLSEQMGLFYADQVLDQNSYGTGEISEIFPTLVSQL